MTMDQSHTPQPDFIDPSLDPAADHEPTRPTIGWVSLGVVIVLVGAAIANWQSVSSYAHAHAPQIEHALHLHVG
jgi:hypothetical protein